MTQPTAAPKPPSGTKKPVFVLIGVIVVVVALCGLFQWITKITSRDDLAGLGTPVPAASTTPSAPAPTWQPPNELTDPNPELQIRHELESWVLESAGTAKPTKSSCDLPGRFTGGSAATFSCTVTYEKNTVTYEVNAKPSSGLTFSWDADTAQNVVTRTGILTAVADRFRTPRFSDLRCEELPQVALVPTGRPIAQHCYVRIEGREKTATIDLIPTRSTLRLDTRLQ
ncbi:hypothetical protein [Actinoplanes couchii]|uniref:DUF4333 domain-containing protein n=1 Tax=Actinoplanes couchii TaxID=403638 RepID=A0ABQ3XR67_9ACTN|nr:hypothetical protein [Actinoplanes couchii]MDR6318171.1 hypothetical protein [Actinoplanes couchii]GID60965.1 hypothetical protein Aco03nite_093690 [Actinoplanes couchii]